MSSTAIVEQCYNEVIHVRLGLAQCGILQCVPGGYPFVQNGRAVPLRYNTGSVDAKDNQVSGIAILSQSNPATLYIRITPQSGTVTIMGNPAPDAPFATPPTFRLYDSNDAPVPGFDNVPVDYFDTADAGQVEADFAFDTTNLNLQVGRFYTGEWTLWMRCSGDNVPRRKLLPLIIKIAS